MKRNKQANCLKFGSCFIYSRTIYPNDKRQFLQQQTKATRQRLFASQNCKTAMSLTGGYKQYA